MYDNPSVSRAKLVDEPLVEMILNKEFHHMNLEFSRVERTLDFEGVDLVCKTPDGNIIKCNVKRNSSKQYLSNNFSLSFKRDTLIKFKETIFIFIDESCNSLYIVKGNLLYSYIMSNQHSIKESKSKSWILISKKEIANFARSSSENSIIQYNEKYAKLFEDGRDENKYCGLL